MSEKETKILDNMKSEISDSIFDSSSYNFEVINNTLKEQDKKLEKEANNLQNQVNALK